MTKRSVSSLNWKELFDKTDERKRVNYDLMYCEDIEILKNDYEKYKMDYFIDIFFESGEFIFELNTQTLTLSSPSSLILQPDSEFRFVSCDNPVISMVIVSKRIRINILDTQAKNISFHSKMKNNPIALLKSEKDIDDARGYINGVKEIMSDTDNPYRLEAFLHFNIYHYYFFFYKKYNINAKNDYGICSKFFVLLETYYLSEKDTNFYAKKLNISKGHLDFTLKKKVGKTAKMCLDERTIIEGKRLLQETDMSIQQIATKLRFPSTMAFSKLFKRVAGVSPSKFRE